MTSENFFKNLPSSNVASGLVDSVRHSPVPHDWAIVIADIQGSTQAVAQGRYKDVNITSSCAIIAVLNRVGRGQIAYIYGGDGATFIIPSSIKFDVAAALYGTQKMAKEDFGLTLRVGMMDVSEIMDAGLEIKLAKIELRPGFFQAALSGKGVGYAEKKIKDPEEGKKYSITSLFPEKNLADPPANFEGFECRWEPLKSRNGVDVSMLVVARMKTEEENVALYQDVFAKIKQICGDEEKWRPLSPAQMHTTGNPLTIHGESKVRTHGKGFAKRMKYLLEASAITFAGGMCMMFGWKMGNFDGGVYKDDTVQNTDFIKFENALKLVMDVTHKQKDELKDYLEDLNRQQKLYYGIHLAPSAMMTCLVFSHDKDHLHFIDGAEGGYTEAARELKKQMQDFSESELSFWKTVQKGLSAA